MAMLDTVADYVRETRALLQDQVVPYRYPDIDLLSALNLGMLSARKLRVDLFLGVTTVPYFTTVDNTAVAMDQQYRLPFVYFMTGHAQLRDEEDTQDQRASAFIAKFTSQLLTAGG
jgi:hypothetical protein